MVDKQSKTKVWYPLGEGTESRIVADTCGTAMERTILIIASCEMLPYDAIRFARQIEGAVEWLKNVQEVFSDAEVEEINRYQKSGKCHPLTCWNGHGALIATNSGLVCPVCDYQQTWCQEGIKNGSWRTEVP